MMKLQYRTSSSLVDFATPHAGATFLVNRLISPTTAWTIAHSTASLQAAQSDLEPARPSSSTSLLELPALALDIWLLVLMRAETEMLDSLSRVLRSTQQQHIATGRSLHCQLIHCQALAASLLNACACGSSEAKGCDMELWDIEEAVVVCDGADNADSLVLVGFLCGSGRDL